MSPRPNISIYLFNKSREIADGKCLLPTDMYQFGVYISRHKCSKLNNNVGLLEKRIISLDENGKEINISSACFCFILFSLLFRGSFLAKSTIGIL
jgi:hypothetical protein